MLQGARSCKDSKAKALLQIMRRMDAPEMRRGPESPKQDVEGLKANPSLSVK